MNYPLSLSFKILAIARQIRVTDATGSMVCYVKQKAFKLKESVTLFADDSKQHALYTIEATKIIDFSASYIVRDAGGEVVTTVRRRGMRSLWKAHYEFSGGAVDGCVIQEANPWTKFLDGIVGDIPILGMFTGYFLHPAYHVLRPNGAIALRALKQPAFFEGKYRIESVAGTEPHEDAAFLAGLVMLILLERSRG